MAGIPAGMPAPHYPRVQHAPVVSPITPELPPAPLFPTCPPGQQIQLTPIPVVSPPPKEPPCVSEIPEEQLILIFQTQPIPSRVMRTSYEKLGPAEAKKIAKALLHPECRVEKLELNGNNLGDAGISEIAAVLKANTSLRKLEIGRNNITGAGMKILAEALAVNTQLFHLSMSGNSIGDEGAIEIAKALAQNKGLEVLCTTDNVEKIGDKGAMEFANALIKNTTLTDLYIGGNSICERGGISIANALIQNSTLKRLYISANNLGDKAAEAFSNALETNTQLQTLDIEDCYIHSNLAAKATIHACLERNKHPNAPNAHPALIPPSVRNMPSNAQLFQELTELKRRLERVEKELAQLKQPKQQKAGTKII